MYQYQNDCDTAVYTFIKSLHFDIPTKLKSLSTLLKALKMQNKFSACPHCKTFKHSGRHCANTECKTFMKSVICFHCNRYFVKIGKHRCAKLNTLNTDSIIPDKMLQSNKSNNCDYEIKVDTNIFADLESDQRLFLPPSDF